MERELNGGKANLRNCFDISSYSENTFMNASNDFADTGFDTCLLSHISDIFSSLSDDDAGVFCADKRA